MLKHYYLSTETCSFCCRNNTTTEQASDTRTAKMLFAQRSFNQQTTLRQNEYGFTLVELITTLSIAGLILTMAVPSFTTMIQNNRFATQTNQFISAMTLARSEAIKRGITIDVVATDSSVATDEWGAGWRVVINGGATLRVFAALEGSSTLNSNNNINTFQYQSSGRANVTDTLSLCDGRSNETGRLISLSTTGRVSVTNLLCS
ncbi:MAG: prepilin-type N-terminal cleavage/methylation domain-containing protein [Gammaproteobacteria bacterium]|nr:prepilin-type N-terminal cleavage/methylation domain-containing protein [Gammaproteobacteria bacterium]